MEKTCETLTIEKEKAIYKKIETMGYAQVYEWCLPFPRNYVIRKDAPREILDKAKAIDELYVRYWGRHHWRNFMTDPEELKAFDAEVEWALKQPRE